MIAPANNGPPSFERTQTISSLTIVWQPGYALSGEEITLYIAYPVGFNREGERYQGIVKLYKALMVPGLHQIDDRESAVSRPLQPKHVMQRT